MGRLTYDQVGGEKILDTGYIKGALAKLRLENVPPSSLPSPPISPLSSARSRVLSRLQPSWNTSSAFLLMLLLWGVQLFNERSP